MSKKTKAFWVGLFLFIYFSVCVVVVVGFMHPKVVKETRR